MPNSTRLDEFSPWMQEGGQVMLRRVPWVQLVIAVAAAAVVALAVGVPSALLANPIFVRMTPVP